MRPPTSLPATSSAGWLSAHLSHPGTSSPPPPFFRQNLPFPPADHGYSPPQAVCFICVLCVLLPRNALPLVLPSIAARGSFVSPNPPSKLFLFYSFQVPPPFALGFIYRLAIIIPVCFPFAPPPPSTSPPCAAAGRYSFFPLRSLFFLSPRSPFAGVWNSLRFFFETDADRVFLPRDRGPLLSPSPLFSLKLVFKRNTISLSLLCSSSRPRNLHPLFR